MAAAVLFKRAALDQRPEVVSRRAISPRYREVINRIVGLRHRIAHDYFDVDLDLI